MRSNKAAFVVVVVVVAVDAVVLLSRMKWIMLWYATCKTNIITVNEKTYLASSLQVGADQKIRWNYSFFVCCKNAAFKIFLSLKKENMK